ncbi:hypothetical protein LIER_02237 [Lithospermum erythrorhizon]|uniref:Uncharacterized protein n=1 Tax=Lithospermum erythrorhizon TaxID=34254 RepID=A0AAV3NPU0_LITER
MCTDFTNLNKSCPKDYYPLPYLGRLVDGSARYGCSTSSMLPEDPGRSCCMRMTRRYPRSSQNMACTVER